MVTVSLGGRDEDTNTQKLIDSNTYVQLPHPSNSLHKGFPGSAVVENLPANAGHTGSSPGEDPTCRGATGPVSHNY